MAFFTTTLQFLAGLTLIVGIHELGHLFFAKLFRIRVEHYMIGFPPKWMRVRWGETEYALGAIPLGGSVRIAGMVDESLAKVGSEASPPQPWEFRSKPGWQRMLVLLGGIAFNLFSAAVAYTLLAWLLGHAYLSKQEVNRYGIVPNELGLQMGFREGDKLMRINGKDFEAFDDCLSPQLLLRSGGYYTVERGGTAVDIPIPKETLDRLASQKRPVPFLQPAHPLVVDGVEPNGKAALAGLRPGDRLLRIQEHPALYAHQLQKALQICQGMEATVAYARQGVERTTRMHLNGPNEMLGLRLKSTLVHSHIRYSLLESIQAGFQETGRSVRQYAWGIWKIITGELAAKNALGGPIAMAQAFGSDFAWSRFWKQFAQFSIAIALTNLWPLPALDGGHALLVAYEMASGRKPSNRFLERVQKIGLALLCLLMLYALSNDVRKLLQ